MLRGTSRGSTDGPAQARLRVSIKLMALRAELYGLTTQRKNFTKLACDKEGRASRLPLRLIGVELAESDVCRQKCNKRKDLKLNLT